VITAQQDIAARSIPLGRRPDAATRVAARALTEVPGSRFRRPAAVQPVLPGFGE
jgi:hypothetical protein